MKISGYLPTSLIEWPGEISAVIFIPGCNFRCPFCHNSDLVNPEKVKKLNLIKEEEILADLKKRKKWLDGLAITGGEPTLEKDLKKFSQKVKSLDLKLMVETNGSRPEIIKSLDLVDFWSLDFKTIWKNYYQLTGFKLKEKIKDSFSFLLKSKKKLRARTTLVPAIHDLKILLKMGQELEKLVSKFRPLGKDFSWQWQNFQPKNTLDPKFEKIKPFSEKELKKFCQEIKKKISFSLEC